MRNTEYSTFEINYLEETIKRLVEELKAKNCLTLSALSTNLVLGQCTPNSFLGAMMTAAQLGLEPKLRHVPAKQDRGAPAYFYAVFRTKDDGYGFDVMSVDDVRAHAQKYSKAYKNGPWQSNFEEMAKKTVLKRVLKYAPLKTEFVRAVAADETIKSGLSEDMFDLPDETVIEVEDFVVDESTGEVVSGERGDGNA